MHHPSDHRSSPPSWVDRMQARIDALPGSTWAWYAGAWLVLSVFVNLVPWLEGVVPPGTLDPYLNSGALYVLLGFAAMHALDRLAEGAWRTFSPATDLDAAETRERVLRLTTMPARPVIVCTVLGVAVSVLYLASQYGRPLDLTGEPVTFLLSIPYIVVGFVGTTVFLYHTVRRSRIIGVVHRDVTTVRLLAPAPLNAFSGLTAATGIALLAIGYVSALTNPDFGSNPATVTIAVTTSVLAIATFVVPLWGIHQLLAVEKSRRMVEIGGLVERVMADIRAHAERGDVTEADGLNKVLVSLLAERDVLARVPTWPWTPEIPRVFATAVVLPILLWVVVRILEQTLV